MAEQTSLWLYEGILLSLTEHNDISAAPSTYCVVKQKKPSMSPTYPIKRRTAQTMANPIVYFRAFFTCCNKRKREKKNLVNHSHEGREKKKTAFTVSEGKGSSSVFAWPPHTVHRTPPLLRTIMSECRSSLTWMEITCHSWCYSRGFF